MVVVRRKNTMPISDIENFLRSWDRDTYAIFAQQGSEPTLQDIDNFQSEVGFSFPEEFREFAVHPLGGLYVEVKEALWRRPKAGDVGAFWTFLYGFRVYSLSKAAPDWLQMRAAWEQMRANGAGEFVPFLKVMGDADPYCFTRSGGVVIWRHESSDRPESVDLGFSDIVMAEIHALEERKNRKLAQR
jgi:hypothetical protein